MAMISHLKQQIEKLQDYKEQVIILKAERDHLEGKTRILNEKVKYLSTPVSFAIFNVPKILLFFYNSVNSHVMCLHHIK